MKGRWVEMMKKRLEGNGEWLVMRKRQHIIQGGRGVMANIWLEGCWG